MPGQNNRKTSYDVCIKLLTIRLGAKREKFENYQPVRERNRQTMEAGRIKVKKTLKSHKTKQHGLTKEQNANEDAFAEKTCKQVLCSQIVDPLLFLNG